jgi:hypothetical protein
VCQEIARKPLWQLRDGRMVSLSQGCFIQPNADVSELGAAALDFIQRKLPLFNVPWHVKSALEAAGVQECNTVTPKAVRWALLFIFLWLHQDSWLAGKGL